MNRLLTVVLLLMVAVSSALAQGEVKGKIRDKKTDEALGYVNVTVTPKGATKLLKGAITDENGSFHLTDLPEGQYTLNVSFVGYRELTRQFSVTSQKPHVHFNVLYLSEDAQVLQEVTVRGQRSTMKLEVDRKTFDVSQDIAKGFISLLVSYLSLNLSLCQGRGHCHHEQSGAIPVWRCG